MPSIKFIQGRPRGVLTNRRFYKKEEVLEALRRQGGRCFFYWLGDCDGPFQGGHFIPFEEEPSGYSRYGSTSKENLVAVCRRHNSSQGRRVPSQWLGSTLGVKAGTDWVTGRIVTDVDPDAGLP
jgi:hypothetical protein